jgi:phosphatidyl-myo-inositol alpha-mannosyltransferase
VSKLRVALVHPFSWPEVRRGGERYLADLIWFLERAGHDVEAITGTKGSSSTSREGDVTVRKLRHLSNRATRVLARDDDESFGIRAYPRLLSRRFDVVHAFVPSAAIAARAARQRTVYTVLGHPSRALVESLPRASRLMRAAVRSSAAVVALSHASARATEEVFGRKTGVLPPGVIMDRFPLAGEPRTGPPRLLFNAFATNPEKGLGTLVDAFAVLLGRIPDARLVLAGPGEPGWALARLDARSRGSVDVLGPGRQ